MPPFYSTVIHFAPHKAYFEGFVNTSRKWHIRPILSRLLGHILCPRKRENWPTILTDLVYILIHIMYIQIDNDLFISHYLRFSGIF